jgi:glycosyltransferase involved in cell wall biosynthesis
MIPNMPCLVSIIVPAFNSGAYLRRCVESILGQSHRELELIVVNDCSSDDTASILNGISAKDPRLKVIHLEENVGVHGARSRGVAEARGEFIGFTDADDWLAPGMIAALLAEATTGQGADIVICGAVLATAIGPTRRHKVRFRRRKEFGDLLLERFCRLEFGLGVLWNKLYRADLIRPYALLNLERKVDAAEDYIVNIGCFAKAARVVVLPETHYFYFEHPESASRSASNAKSFSRTFRAYVACLEAYSDSLREDFSLITGLYGRQLKMSCYLLRSAADLAPFSDELRESLERLARVHPEGVYSLVHAFDHAWDRGSMRPRPALRRLFAATKDVVQACANLLAAGRCN